MITFRGWRRIAAVIVLAAFGVLVVAISATQTRWFKDWLRVYVTREAERYLDGQLQVARLEGNLFTGVRLVHVQLLQGGKEVLAADSVDLAYNVLTIVAQDVIVDDLSIARPVIRMRRDAAGWNLSHLVRKEASEADRQGPGRPVLLRRIRITDGRVDIDDQTATDTSTVRLPQHVGRIDFDGSFSYKPVDFTLTVDHLSLLASNPDAMLRNLTGTFAIRGDDVHVEKLTVETAYSNLRVDGMVRDYLGTPIANLTLDSNRVTLAEFAALVPAMRGFTLHPAFDITVAGSLDKLRSDVQLRSEAGALQGGVSANVLGPTRTLEGDLSFSQLDASVVVPSQPPSSLTGRTTFDLTLDRHGRSAGTARVHLSPSRAAGYAIDSADAQLRLDGEHAKLSAQAAAYGATATTVGTVELPADRRALAFDLRGRVAHLGLHRLPVSAVPRLRTDMTATYRVVGTSQKSANDRLSARATFDRSSIEGAHLERGTTIHVDQSAGQLSYSARGAIANLNPERLGKAVGIVAMADDRLDGSIDAGFTVEGHGRTLPTLSATAELAVSRAAFQAAHMSDVRVRAHADRGTFEGAVRGSFDAVNPARLVARPDLEGSLAGTLDAEVTLPDLQSPEIETATGRVALDLAPSTVAGRSLRRASVQATLSRGTAEVSDLTVDTGQTNLHASGTVAVGRDGDSHLTYAMSAGSLDEIGRFAGVSDLAGMATLDGTLTGNRRRFRTNGTVSLTNLRYGTTVEALSARSDFDVEVPDLDVHQADASATTHATFVKAGGQEIRDFTAKTRYSDQSLAFDTALDQPTRRVEVRGAAQLQQTGAVDVRLDHLLVGTDKMTWSTPQDGPPAEVSYSPPQLLVKNLQLGNGEQRISASGSLRLDEAAALKDGGMASVASAPPSALSMTAEHLDLAQLDDLLAGDRGLAGTLDATATISGALSNPIADATLTITKGAAQKFTYDRLTADAHHDGTGARVDLRLDQSPGAWLTLNASLPGLPTWREPEARRGAPIAAHLTTSTLDLALVQMVTTAVKDVAGTARADLTVGGTVAAPQLSGTLSIDGGRFLVNETDTRFQGMQAAIRLHDDQVSIDTLRVLDENGHPLSATGTLAFDEQRVGAVDLRIAAQDFQAMKSRLGELSVDVDGGVSGALPAVAIRGNVTVRDGRIEVDRVLEQMSGSTYATESAPIESVDVSIPAASASPPAPAPANTTTTTPAANTAPAQGPSMFDAVSLDAHVRIPNNLVLRGESVRTTSGGLSIGNLNLTIGGEIKATKASGDRPLVVGSIRTVRGFYEFQGRRFDLQRDSTVSFKGPDPTDPTLDVTGIRDIAGIEARVHVHGTAQHPALDISSTPPLDEADVLSLIVFNRPVNELGEGERTSVAQTAATMVGGLVTAPLAEALRNALDVDLLEVSAGGESGAGPSVAIGNQVGEKVFFKVRQQFGSADVTEFLLDYQLTEMLRLQTTVVEGGETNRTPGRRIDPAGLDFVFVKKY